MLAFPSGPHPPLPLPLPAVLPLPPFIVSFHFRLLLILLSFLSFLPLRPTCPPSLLPSVPPLIHYLLFLHRFPPSVLPFIPASYPLYLLYPFLSSILAFLYPLLLFLLFFFFSLIFSCPLLHLSLSLPPFHSPPSSSPFLFLFIVTLAMEGVEGRHPLHTTLNSQCGISKVYESSRRARRFVTGALP